MDKPMKVLVMKEYQKFEWVDWERPQITPSQVLVHVRAVSLCGSDIGGSNGKSGRRIPPIIMGHEASGDIVEVGTSVRGWQKGQRVTFDSTEYCGECRFCRKGQINLCDNRKVLGVSCDEYRRHGALAEYVAVESRTLYALSQNVSYEQGALVEPLSVGVHAVAISPIQLGDDVLINGCGTIGLMTLQAVKASGASRIIMSDLDDGRLDTAKAMGATDCVNTSKDDLRQYVADITCGKGVDIAFDAVGVESSILNAIYSLRKGGCLVGIGNMSQVVNFPLQDCITRQIRFQGSYSSSGEYDVSLAMIASGKIDLTPFLQANMPLSEGKQAFQRFYDREPGLLKIVLTNK